MLRTYKPLRARKRLNPVSPNKFKAKGAWHPQVKRATPSEMHKLRTDAFNRSDGICECSPDCTQKVTWFNGDLHHTTRPKSDELDKVLFVYRDHHVGKPNSIHPGPQWSKRA